MSTAISSSLGQSTAQTQADQGNPYASRFAALVNQLKGMTPADYQKTMADINTQSAPLAQKLQSFLALSPADQLTAIAKMTATSPTDPLATIVAHLETLSPAKLTAELQRVGRTDAKLAAKLRDLMAMTPAERQQVIDDLQNGTTTPAATTTKTQAQMKTLESSLKDSLMPGQGLDQLQADDVAANARAQAEAMIAQTRNTLMDVLSAAQNGGSAQSAGSNYFDLQTLVGQPSAAATAATDQATAAAGQSTNPMADPQPTSFWMSPAGMTPSNALSAYASNKGVNGI